MRFDSSMDSLNVTRSESVTDLNSELSMPHTRRSSIGHTRNDDNFITTPPKSFGIGKNSFSIFLLIISLLLLSLSTPEKKNEKN